jgi:hypothetical protein
MLRPQRWEEGLSSIQHPASADSLIPMFESMVDRALSRTTNDSVSTEPKLEAVGVTETGSRRIKFDYPPLPQRIASKT